MPGAPRSIRIIVNADDLGISTQANDAIADLMSRGMVTSSTMMANGPKFDEAVDRIAPFTNASFGVHLNLTTFRPLTTHRDLEVIVDDTGTFAGNVREVAFTRSLRRAIFGEWCAQIEKVRERGVNVSHLDSHHHVHTIPLLFLTLRRVQQHFGIRGIRISKNVYSPCYPASRAVLMKKRIWNTLLRSRRTTKTTCGFTEFGTFLEAARRDRVPWGTVELMVHPGHPDFADETASLKTPWIDRMPFNVELINYHTL